MGLQFFAWQQVPTPKLRPRQRPSHGTAMVASMATDLVWAMEVMALATARGLLMPMPTPGMDTEDSMVTDSQPMVATDTDCGARRRGLPRLMPGLDMVDSMATVLVWAMAAMAMEVLATDMERGLLMLRPSLRPTPGSDMVDSTATVLVWAMAAMAMEALATDMERGPLRPSLRPTPGTDMVDFTATVLAWAMAVWATDTERGPLRPSLRPMPGTDMVASTATDSQPMAVTATDCGERSKHDQKHRLIITCNKPNDLIGLDP